MSILMELKCDGAKCHEKIRTLIPAGLDLSANDCLEQAFYEQGWQAVEGWHICPDCKQNKKPCIKKNTLHD